MLPNRSIAEELGGRLRLGVSLIDGLGVGENDAELARETNPTSDSARTRITLTSRNELVTVYAPRACEPARLDAVLDDTEGTLTRFCGGTVLGRRILPAG